MWFDLLDLGFVSVTHCLGADIHSPFLLRRRIVRHQIGDFGIALNMKSGQQSLQHIDLEGDPIYLPAELLSHEFPIGPAVDMFSLGATIFEVRDPGCVCVCVCGGR